MNKKISLVPLLFVFLIVVLSVAFHYPVHIENALTHQPEPGFDVTPSVIRTVFEPVLGLLLYFNKAYYAIEEFGAILVWSIAVFFICSVWLYVKKKNKATRLRFLVNQLFNLPVLVGVWFALFVVLIFIRLPNDHIENKSNGWVLVTTHSHTNFSHDGLISEEGLLKWHQRNGFDAFFITDHSNHGATLQFVNLRKGKEKPGEPVVFCGEEFSGSNHLSLLGLKSDFVTRGQSDSTVVAKARTEGAAIIVNHWFDGEHKSLEYYKKLGVDGFEIENTATDKRYNREVYQRIRTFCESNELIMNGGLDFHGYGSACTIWNACNIPQWKDLDYDAKQEAVLNIIKAHNQSKLKVLLLNDRPFYPKKHLLLSPLITLFNYFRTLNLLQVLSWICWILIVSLLKIRLFQNQESLLKITGHQIWAVLGLTASIFLTGLGLFYFSQVQHIAEFTKMYPEYGRLLLSAGIPLLILSVILLYFRIFKSKTT